MSPLLQPNVEIITAIAMMLSPAPPNIAWRAAVPMGGWFSVEAIWMATRGSTFRYATLASRYRVVTTSTPTAMANGMSRSGCFSSPEAKPTLFQASIENSDPTIAAPMAVAPTATPPVAQKLAPKLAATAAAFPPMVTPGTMMTARGAVHVRAPCVGRLRGECASGERAQQRRDASHRQRREQEPGGVDLARDLRRDDEDSRADHRAHDEGRGVEPGDRFDELGLRLLRGRHPWVPRLGGRWWSLNLVAFSGGRYLGSPFPVPRPPCVCSPGKKSSSICSSRSPSATKKRRST